MVRSQGIHHVLTLCRSCVLLHAAYHPESGYIQKSASASTTCQRRSATITRRLLVLSLIVGMYLASSYTYDPLSPYTVYLVIWKHSKTGQPLRNDWRDTSTAMLSNAWTKGVPALPKQSGQNAFEVPAGFDIYDGMSVKAWWYIGRLWMMYYAAMVCLWGYAAQNVYALLRLDSLHNIYAKSTVFTTSWTLHACSGGSFTVADLCWGTLWYALRAASLSSMTSILLLWAEGLGFWMGCFLLQYLLFLNIRHLYLRLLPLLFTQAVLAVQQVVDFCFAGHNSVLWHNEKLVHKSLTGIFAILVVLDKYLSINVMGILLQLVSWFIGTIIA